MCIAGGLATRPLGRHATFFGQVLIFGIRPGSLYFRSGSVACVGAISSTLELLLCKS